jgi:hypothetical protein
VVKDTGADARIGAPRPLREPRLVKVVEKPEGWPCELHLGKMLKVVSVEDRWRIDDEWWREQPISRMYFECTLEDGRQLTVFQDLLTGGWYRQSG